MVNFLTNKKIYIYDRIYHRKVVVLHVYKFNSVCFSILNVSNYSLSYFFLGKNKMEMFGGLMKSFSKTKDEYYLSATVKDVNDFFDQEMTFLTQYHQNLKEATSRADRQTVKHKDMADSYIKISTNILQLATTDGGKLEKFLTKIAETFEKLRVSY